MPLGPSPTSMVAMTCGRAAGTSARAVEANTAGTRAAIRIAGTRVLIRSPPGACGTVRETCTTWSRRSHETRRTTGCRDHRLSLSVAQAGHCLAGPGSPCRRDFDPGPLRRAPRRLQPVRNHPVPLDRLRAAGGVEPASQARPDEELGG